ncbi:sensor histidine kinase [Amycolatopsis balhimycina DSM 5908]|uniref:histidine kinase n=1 Tax=Amycolatopsis balhimycina DSM 5908 TaxID=1081091 RepID=A0A428WV72_AMYBA|nr:sensor histidine kinase [Amycolatopsis balhimycina]RSM46965.1 sensor histidine kinase [Amycolatopsis balhimycina DSM 5908]
MTRHRAVVVVLAGSAAALGAAAVLLEVRDGTHPMADVLLTSLSGTAFVVAGLIADRRAPSNRSGLLMVLVGLGLFAEDLQLSPNAVVFTAGLLLAHASAPLVVHLMASFPAGRPDSRIAKGIVVGAYVVAFGVSAAGVPFVDWAARFPGKPENLLLVVDAPAVGDAVGRTLEPAGAVIGVALLLLLARRLSARTPGVRRPLGLVVAVALAGAALSAVASSLGSGHPAQAGVLTCYKIVFCLWPVTFAAGVVWMAPRVGGVADLLAAVRQPCSPAELCVLLGRVLRDPSLRLVGWHSPAQNPGLPDTGGSAGPGERTVVLAECQGRPIAAVLSRDTTWDDPRVIRAAGTVVGMVADRLRLLDEIDGQLAEFRRSRVRLVELADAERRRVERDLHDGAQQRLVAVAIGLRLARQRLEGHVEPALAQLLAAGAEGLETAIGELRDLARGIHPAVLTQAGLVPAVTSLAERCPVPASVSAADLPGLPAAVAATAYFVVAEAITNVLKHAGATRIRVCLVADAGRLTVSVRDDGAGCETMTGGSGLAGLAERVRALDGRLTIHSGHGGGTAVWAEIPLDAAAPDRVTR